MNNQDFLDILRTGATSTIDAFQYKGYNFHKVYSTCQVDIWNIGEKAIVLLTDLNRGTSVTTAAQSIITEVYKEYLSPISKDNCYFFETYNGISIDQQHPTWEGDKCTNAVFTPLGKIN